MVHTSILAPEIRNLRPASRSEYWSKLRTLQRSWGATKNPTPAVWELSPSPDKNQQISLICYFMRSLVAMGLLHTNDVEVLATHVPL